MPLEAVLLDVGGVLLLPHHDRVLGALTRAGFAPRAEVLDRAHYAGAARLDDEAIKAGWPQYWQFYLDAYVTECGVPDELHAEAIEHLGNEFTVGALWTRVVPGALDGLRALAATGVRLGIVSNAEGTIEQELSETGVAQRGAGAGVAVETVIDSTVVGVAKPDPRIFRIALAEMGVDPADAWYVGDTPCFDVTGAYAAGIRPLLMDPCHFHERSDCDRVGSLHEVAALVGDELGPAQGR